VLVENVYNMDETGVMLSMLKSIKVLVGKEEMKAYRGTGVKRTFITAICWIPDHGALPDRQLGNHRYSHVLK
jgi:hypothetical protein